MADDAGVLVEPDQDHRRHHAEAEAVHRPVERSQDRSRRGGSGVGDTASEVAELAHDGRRILVVAGDVTDDQGERTVGHRKESYQLLPTCAIALAGW